MYQQTTTNLPLVLSLDIGTSSVRALAYDATGRQIDASECQLKYVPETRHDGMSRVDADVLFTLCCDAITGALKNLRESANHIAAVGISCFWHSLLGVDAGKQHDDQRTAVVG